MVRTPVAIGAADGRFPLVESPAFYPELTVSLPIPDLVKLFLVNVPEGIVAAAAGEDFTTDKDLSGGPPIITGNDAVEGGGIDLLVPDLEEMIDIVFDAF